MEWQDKLFEDFRTAAHADEEREFPAQERLWEKIEKQLDYNEQKPKRIAFRRVMYVAASAMLLLGLSLTWLFSSDENIVPGDNILAVENKGTIRPVDTEEQQSIVSAATVTNEAKVPGTRPKTRAVQRTTARADIDTAPEGPQTAIAMATNDPGPALSIAGDDKSFPKEEAIATDKLTNVVASYRSVNGVIIDKNGPVPGAVISIKDGTRTVRADNKGNFIIEVPQDKSELIVTSFGAETKVVALNEKESYMVQLEPDYKGAEVYSSIVNGKDKRGHTRSLNTVIPQSITSRPANSITEVLERATPGLLPTKGIGLPPLASENVLVNQPQIYNNDPLIIVNGAPFLGKFSEINPKDIEKIDLLSDAAGRALFGSRARNGVIQVTLKQGKSIDDMKQIKKRKSSKR